MNETFYAVCFDNDPDFPGKLQWCNLGDMADPGNLTKSLERAQWERDDMAKHYPQINYRVMRLTAEDVL